MSESIRQVLTETDFEFSITTSRMAVSVAEEFRPHYVICDFDLPKEPDCTDLLLRLRRIPDLGKARFIAYTLNPRSESVAQAAEFGFDEVWEKTEFPNLLRTLPPPTSA